MPLDFFENGQATGTVAQRLAQSNMNVNNLRTNATLRKDEWKHFDRAVVEAARQRLVGVADLISRGLVYDPGSGMAATVLDYEVMSDLNGAEISMDALTKGNNDSVEYEIKYLPLPIIHKDWQLGIRQLTAARNGNRTLDITQAAMAARKVSEETENLLFRGAGGFKYGGGTLWGYLDHPARLTMTAPTPWASASGEGIVKDCVRMKQNMIDNQKYGPYMIYVSPDNETRVEEDYNSNRSVTIRERILKLTNIVDVKTADALPPNTVIMVQLTAETVRMVNPLPINNVEWEVEGGLVSKFKVLQINVPQVRAGENKICGVVHLTTNA